MNRSMKFKVWDTKEKEWLINPLVTFIHHEKSWGNEFYLEIDEDWNNEDYDPMRYLFLQDTGLKDKNGKEIYEGDIVTYKGLQLIVSFCNGHFFIHNGKTDGDKYKCNHEDLWKALGRNTSINSKPIFLQKNEVFVIGNIYDNPELIKND